MHVVNDENSLFIVTDDGAVTCVDAESGRIRWSQTGTYRNPLVPHDDDPEFDPAQAVDRGWSSRLVDGRLQWRSPNGVTRAADTVTGAELAVLENLHLISCGWTDEWLDAEHSEWELRRTFQDGAVRLLTAGAGWDDDHRGALAIRCSDDEVVYGLEPGWQYDHAVVAIDSAGVALLAERQRELLDHHDDEEDETESPDESREWLLTVRLDKEAGIVVGHGGWGRSDVTYDDLALENVPRDIGAHVPTRDSYNDAPSDPTLTIWLFVGDTA